MINITLQQVAEAISIIVIISGFFISLYKWFKNNIENKLNKHEDLIATLIKENMQIKEENTVLLKGQLACLKGLKEKGCNGPVTTSIDEIEKFLLNQVHK